MKLVNVNEDSMQAFVTINKGGIMINADVNPKNWLTNEYVIKGLFGIQVIVNMNMIKKWGKRLIDKLVTECGEQID